MFLIVDDDCAIREELDELLILRGFTGRSAENGNVALQLLRARSRLPKLILLDIIMPVLDGWGFLLERNKDPRLVTVPVIVISASLGIEKRARTAGAHSVMRKPLEPCNLLSVIEPIFNAAWSPGTASAEPTDLWR
jgi:two-component system, chemotaxis family, chemotaxis protein CheY